MNEKFHKFQEVSGQYMFIALIIAMVIQVNLFLVQYILGASSFYLVLLVGFLPPLIYIFCKDKSEEKHIQIGNLLVKISLFIFVAMLINHVFISLVNVVGTDSVGAGAFIKLRFLTMIFLIISAVVVYRNPKVKEVFENMKTESIFDKIFADRGAASELKPGDIRMGVNKETKKPVIWRYKDRFLHMLILGPTGSGKTSQTIIPFVNQDMQNIECGITVIEPKGDLAEKVYAMAEHYGRKAVYFNPILPNCPYFNPLFGKEADVVENMSTTFKMLSADSPQFFLDMNDTLIRNSLKVLKRLYGNKANLIEFSRLIQNSGGLGRKMVQQFSRLPADTPEIAKENADIAAWFLSDYFAERSKTYEHCSGLRSQVSKIISNYHLRRVLNPPNGENDVDFDKHLEEGGVITISTAQGELQDLGKFLGYFIILQFQSAVFKRPGNENTRRAHFLYIDEFQTYANAGFANMLTQGRSYRVASHLATQNRALIGMNAGKDAKTFVELVSTNARNIIIYPGANAIDADYYSKQFGQIMKVTRQVGITRQKFNPLKGIKPMSYDSESIRDVEALEFRFTPTDIIYRPFGEITYCLIENNSVGEPGVATIEYIPKELNDKLDEMVDEYKEEAFSLVEHEKPQSELEMQIENAPESVVPQEVVVKKKSANKVDTLKMRDNHVEDDTNKDKRVAYAGSAEPYDEEDGDDLIGGDSAYDNRAYDKSDVLDDAIHQETVNDVFGMIEEDDLI